MILDFNELESLDRYKIMSQTIIPRPIAWIVTEDEVVNVAPFSYFTGLSSNPPTIIVSIGHKKSGDMKDSLKNILKNKRATICFVDEESLEKMHFSSKELSSNISEAKIFDIKTEKIFEDFPPIIENSPAAFFCTLYQKIDLKESKTIPLILEIKKYFINDRYIKDKEKFHIDLNLVGRVGKEYAICNKKVTPPTIP